MRTGIPEVYKYCVDMCLLVVVGDVSDGEEKEGCGEGAEESGGAGGLVRIGNHAWSRGPLNISTT